MTVLGSLLAFKISPKAISAGKAIGVSSAFFKPAVELALYFVPVAPGALCRNPRTGGATTLGLLGFLHSYLFPTPSPPLKGLDTFGSSLLS